MISIGPGGSSAYQVPTFAPISQGLGMLGSGLGQGILAMAERKRAEEAERKANENLLSMWGGFGEGGVQGALQAGAESGFLSDPQGMQFLSFLSSLGGEQAPHINLRRPDGSVIALQENSPEFMAEVAAGAVIAGQASATPPEPEAPLETFSTVQSPFGLGGVGQVSDLSGKVTNYQAPTAGATGKTKAYYNPVTNEAQAFYEGSPEEAQAVADGWVPGRPEGPREQIEKPADIRKEFRAQSKMFIDTQDSFRRLQGAAKDESAQGDIALIFNFMKTLDPQSVVRESEFSLAQNAAGFGDRVEAAVNQILNGERLLPEVRQGFIDTATRAYVGMAEQQQRHRAQYESIATSYGYEPDKTLIDYLDQDLLASVTTAPVVEQGSGDSPPPEQPGDGAAVEPPSPSVGVTPGDASVSVIFPTQGEGVSEVPDMPAGGEALRTYVRTMSDAELTRIASTVDVNSLTPEQRTALADEWETRGTSAEPQTEDDWISETAKIVGGLF